MSEKPPSRAKRRVRLDLEYLGTRYAGFQLQPNGLSIQEIVEKALSTLVNHPVRVIPSGRTDAGVHARLQPVHADISSRLSDEDILRGMNALLPDDVAVISVKTVPDDWHARFSAREKTYVYTILNRPAPSAFDHGRVWHVRKPLDVEAMRKAAGALIGEHDFSSFRSSGCAAKNPVRSLSRLEVEKEGDVIRITFTAGGFLKQMVRNIVGTLVEVGRGRIAPEEVSKILAAKDRRAAGPCAPPEGLFLVEVKY
ncbi:MAG: tRNA pseudouridine(38-40) synthase TruA [Candidatus Nitrospinota bacterium M3_3B_026]